MNRMKHFPFMAGIAMFTFFLITPAMLMSQSAQYTDTVRYDLGNRIQLVLALEDAMDIKEITGITDLSQQLNKDLAQLGDEVLQSPQPLLVHYRYVSGAASKLVIKQASTSRQAYSFSTETNGPQANKVGPDTLMIHTTGNYDIILIADYLEDLKALEDINIDLLLRETMTQSDQASGQESLHTRFRVNRLYTVSNNKIVGLADASESQAYDQLVLQSKPGIGLLRNRWVPEWSLDLGIRLFDKRRNPLTQLGLRLSSHYFFERKPDKKYDMFVNLFADAYYRTNINRRGETPFWLGFSAGYLIRSSGDYFGENTFRGALIIGNGQRKVQVQPEFYFTDNFEQIFPGIRFSFGL